MFFELKTWYLKHVTFKYTYLWTNGTGLRNGGGLTFIHFGLSVGDWIFHNNYIKWCGRACGCVWARATSIDHSFLFLVSWKLKILEESRNQKTISKDLVTECETRQSTRSQVEDVTLRIILVEHSVRSSVERPMQVRLKNWEVQGQRISSIKAM